MPSFEWKPPWGLGELLPRMACPVPRTTIPLSPLKAIRLLTTAFDEELIGKYTMAEKENLLDFVKPRYLILKPTLHGGLKSCEEWISLAESRGIGWWITSALESNIGLNAICQFVSNYRIEVPQGLGTGAIYVNNVLSPLMVEEGHIYYRPEALWGEI